MLWWTELEWSRNRGYTWTGQSVNQRKTNPTNLDHLRLRCRQLVRPVHSSAQPAAAEAGLAPQLHLQDGLGQHFLALLELQYLALHNWRAGQCHLLLAGNYNKTEVLKSSAKKTQGMFSYKIFFNFSFVTITKIPQNFLLSWHKIFSDIWETSICKFIITVIHLFYE